MITPNTDNNQPIPVTSYVRMNTENIGQYASQDVLQSSVIDFSQSNNPYIILTNGLNTISFINPLSGSKYLIELIQPTSGAAGTVTFSNTIRWQNGTPPTLSIVNNKSDFIGIWYRHGVYFGNFSLNY